MDIPVLRGIATRAPLGPFERALVNVIDGTRSMQELASELSVSSAEVAAVCSRLYDLELIDLVPPGSRQAPQAGQEVDEAWEAERETMMPDETSVPVKR